MGSFNETCALTNLNIPYGTKVRLLFLTQNPYLNSDQKEAQRGCYSTDQWFVRTPPIKGTYDDYGRCKFKPNQITSLICEMFQKDVVERPFGFNQYHAGDVTKSKGIHHFLHAAWQGRLLVQDDYTRPRKEAPERFPTWQKIQAIFKQNKLPIQSESKQDEGCKGYNAQPVIPGVVCVDFNDYGDNTARLKKVQAILEQEYDCRLVKKFEDRDSEACLLVSPKGANENPQLLLDEGRIKDVLNTHPEILRHHHMFGSWRQMPVLAVMIREDVWQAYANVKVDEKHYAWFDAGRPKTREDFHEALKKVVEKYAVESKKEFFFRGELGFRELLFHLPFQCTPTEHIMAALEREEPFPMMDQLVQDVADLARIEWVMNSLHQPWYIPPLGGQEPAWALRTQLLKDVLAISQKELDDQEREYEAENEEEDEDA